MGKQKPELPQARLDMLVLKALWLGSDHGYGVGQRVRALPEEMLKVEEGTLYPALYRFEQRGLDQERVGSIGIERRARF